MADATYPRLDIRADQRILDRLDRLAAALCEPGVNVKRSGAARAALLRGLEVLEEERGIARGRGARQKSNATSEPKARGRR